MEITNLFLVTGPAPHTENLVSSRRSFLPLFAFLSMWSTSQSAPPSPVPRPTRALPAPTVEKIYFSLTEVCAPLDLGTAIALSFARLK